jgi:hypothetical protein
LPRKYAHLVKGRSALGLNQRDSAGSQTNANVPQSETEPAGKTWYFPIRLDAANPTGVFVPQQFGFRKDGKKVDVILFFHGNKVDEYGKFLNNNINYYWSGKYYSVKLREDLNTSRKNAVLVAPTMGDTPGQGLASNTDLGIFRVPGGEDCFLEHVMKWLGHYDTRFATAELGSVILAGHSGSGSPILLQRFESGRRDHFGALTDHFLDQLQNSPCLKTV